MLDLASLFTTATGWKEGVWTLVRKFVSRLVWFAGWGRMLGWTDGWVGVDAWRLG